MNEDDIERMKFRGQDVVGLVMELCGIDFREAVLLLADGMSRGKFKRACATHRAEFMAQQEASKEVVLTFPKRDL